MPKGDREILKADPEDGTTPKICLWCGDSLPKYRRKYCSSHCADEYFVHFMQPLWWVNARKIALERAEYKCVECGTTDRLEVHHIDAVEPWLRHNSSKNRQDNLKVLCKSCHVKAHHSASPKQQAGMEFNYG